MLNAKIMRKITEELKNKNEMELMHSELELMLERELTKPAEEMDAELVDELLKALEPEEIPTGAQQECWAQIEEQLPGRSRRRVGMTLRRVAACLLAVIAVTFVSFETARAFRWSFLLKLLAPVAETFGLYSASHIEADQTAQDDTVYSVEDTPFQQVQYDSLADFPEEWDGHRVQPVWMPERFEFIQGSIYEDEDIATLNVSYKDGEDFLVLVTTFFYNDDAVSAYEYERTLKEPLYEEISGCSVTYYRNMDEDRLSASWIVDNAHYFVAGNMSESELKHIISALIDT